MSGRKSFHTDSPLWDPTETDPPPHHRNVSANRPSGVERRAGLLAALDGLHDDANDNTGQLAAIV